MKGALPCFPAISRHIDPFRSLLWSSFLIRVRRSLHRGTFRETGLSDVAPDKHSQNSGGQDQPGGVHAPAEQQHCTDNGD